MSGELGTRRSGKTGRLSRSTPVLLLWAGLFLGSGLLLLPSLAAAQAAAGASAGSASDSAAAGDDLLSGFDEPAADAGKDADLASGFDDDPLASGFDDASPLDDPKEAEVAPESPWALNGFMRLDSAYAYAHDPPSLPTDPDYRGWRKLRVALQLELSLKLSEHWNAFMSGQGNRDVIYSLRSRDNYSAPVLEAYEQESEFREVYLRGTPASWLDLKLGRQIVVWGKSDSIRVVDVLNPVDNREPGLTDLEDLRLPVTMTRADLYFGAWSLTGVAVHEVRFNKNPVLGSDFYPLPFPFVIPDVLPSHGGANTEYGAALSGLFSGWDLGFYWAQVWNDDPRPTGANLALSMPPSGFVHDRLTVGGLAASAVVGSWLFKGEAARVKGYEFDSVPGMLFTRSDAMLGVEYSGLSDATLTLEAAMRHLSDYGLINPLQDLAATEDVIQYVLGYRGSFLREQLELGAFGSFFGVAGEEGGAQRYQARYEIAPALHVTGGFAVYTPGPTGSTFDAVRDNDRLFFDLKWDY